MTHVCSICGYKYDDSAEPVPFAKLPDDWACPVCGVGKELFKAEETPEETKAESPAKGKTSSEVLMETFANCGLKWVFGMVGHSNLGAADAVRKLAEAGRMNFIGIRHEGAAAFACSAYGKLTGRPAACLTIAGPGSTNLITGLYDAKLDGAPAIALTGQIPSSELGYYAFQEIELSGLFSDAAPSSFTLASTSRPADVAVAAWRNSILGKAPAQIVLPDDMQVFENGSEAGTVEGALARPACVPLASDISAAAKFIAGARSPIIIVGEGGRRAVGAVVNFAEKTGVPMVTTYRAKGFVADSHPLACGVVGRSGTSVANGAVSDCDLIIGLGTSFSRHSEIPKGKKIIQIDANPAAFGRLRKVDFPLLGEISQTLPLLLSELENLSPSFEDRRESIAAAWSAWRAEKAKRAAKSSENAIDPAAACAALTKSVAANAIVSVDVGNVAYAFGRYFEAEDQRMLLSFYLGSIGVGLPSAMGAWCASKEKGGECEGRPVVAVVGDGGLGQYLAEWTTVAKYGMDIKCVVFNNSELAKISLEQRNAHFDVWETSLVNPNFAEYAKLCGTYGVRISDPAQLDAKLAEAFAVEGPALIEIMTAP